MSTPRERRTTLLFESISCRACARRAELSLATLPGVIGARVDHDETARVVYDAEKTSEGAIARAMERAGYAARPASDAMEERGARALDVAIAVGVVAFASLVAVDIANGPGPTSVAAGLAKFLFAAIIVTAFGRALLGPWAPRNGRIEERMALVAAGAALLMGSIRLAFLGMGAPWVPALATKLGFRVEAWRAFPDWAFEGAAAIALATGAAKRAANLLHAHAARELAARRSDAETVVRVVADDGETWARIGGVRRGARIRLAEGEAAPSDLVLDSDARFAATNARGQLTASTRRAGDAVPKGAILLDEIAFARVAKERDVVGDALDDAASRALAAIERSHSSWMELAGRAAIASAIGLAALAFFTHALFGHGVLSPRAMFAAIAVIAACGTSAFLGAGPVSHAIAVLRARSLGAGVRDAHALEALAAIDTMCIDERALVISENPRVSKLAWMDAPDRTALEAVLAISERVVDAKSLDERDLRAAAARAVASYLRGAGVEAAPWPDDARLHVDEVGAAAHLRGATFEVALGARSEILFAKDGDVLGRFEMEVPLRDGVLEMVTELHARGVRCRVMSNGSSRDASALGGRLGLPAHARLRAAEEALLLRDLQHGGARVAMIGRPAVASRADAAIAIVSTSRPSSLPIALREDAGTALPLLVDVARAVKRRRREMAVVGALFNAILLPLAALGVVAPAVAAGMGLAESLACLAIAARMLAAGKAAAAPERAEEQPKQPACSSERQRVRARVARPELVASPNLARSVASR